MTRLLAELLHPFTLPFLVVGFGVVFLWFRRREGRGRLLLITVPFAILTLLCTPAAGRLAVGSLEWRYLPAEHQPAEADAIVVLSGGLRRLAGAWPEEVLGTDTLRRCLTAVRVYNDNPGLPVVVTGGKKNPNIPGPLTAHVMRDFVVSLGVPPDSIIVEDQSRNTHENAAFTRQLLEKQRFDRVILVTEASHMLRSELCFRKEGFTVIPRCCYFRTDAFEWKLEAFLPRPSAVRNWQLASHEWLGLVWYRVRGWV
jgi:uncharacterized SAM-binding protein YcdF (DUF218 family)